VFEVQLACFTDNHLTDKHKPATYTFIALFIIGCFTNSESCISPHGFRVPCTRRFHRSCLQEQSNRSIRGCSHGTAGAQDHHRPTRPHPKFWCSLFSRRPSAELRPRARARVPFRARARALFFTAPNAAPTGPTVHT
jgi:hypothetical protein